MQSSLEITCDPKLWTNLGRAEQMALKLKSSDPVFFWGHKSLGGFVENEDGVGGLWPSQKEILNQFYELDENGQRKKLELLFAAGMRSSKTTIAALIILTELYKCLMMDSPQKFYRLLPKQPILFLCTAPKEQQAIDTIFAACISIIEESPFFASFKDKIEVTHGKLVFPKKLIIQAFGPNIRTNIGRTVKVFVAEEINSTGEDTYKISPKFLYTKLAKSTSTFIPQKANIKVAISSKGTGNDFLSTTIREREEQGLTKTTTLVIQKTTLEMNPNLTEEMLREEKLADEGSYMRDYGFGDFRDGSNFFKDRTMQKFKAWNRHNIFQGEPEIGSKSAFYPDLDLQNFKLDPTYVEYLILTDPASVNDGFGITVLHLRNDGKVIIDGTSICKSGPNEEIDSKIVQRMMEEICKVIPITLHKFDVYMFPEIKEMLKTMGVDSEQHILRLPDWEKFKNMVNNNMVEGPHSDYLIWELDNLKLHNGKINHTASTTKDMSDPICQGVIHWMVEEEEQEKKDSLRKGKYRPQMIITRGVR